MKNANVLGLLIGLLLNFCIVDSAKAMRDQLGYVDGMSLYSSYHVLHEGLDPSGNRNVARPPVARPPIVRHPGGRLPGRPPIARPGPGGGIYVPGPSRPPYHPAPGWDWDSGGTIGPDGMGTGWYPVPTPQLQKQLEKYAEAIARAQESLRRYYEEKMEPWPDGDGDGNWDNGSKDRCPDPCEQLAGMVANALSTGMDNLIDTYQNLLGRMPPGFQRHHNLQDAMMRPRVPRPLGISIPLHGNAFAAGSPHNKFHSCMNDFWRQFKKQGQGQSSIISIPTMGDYLNATSNCYQEAGCNDELAEILRQLGQDTAAAEGLGLGDLVPRIPRPGFDPRQ